MAEMEGLIEAPPAGVRHAARQCRLRRACVGWGAMSAFVELLGPSLVATGTSKVKRFDTQRTSEALAGKHVGLLFAASGCAQRWALPRSLEAAVACLTPPSLRTRRSDESRAFCRQLAESSRAVQAQGSAFQVVLVSSDRNVDAFARMLADTPGWLALPYTDALRAKEAQLAKRFGVQAVPALVMLSPGGEVINKAAQERVGSPERFPWPPPSVEEALGEVFLNVHGDRVRLRGSLSGGSFVALFFGAAGNAATRAFAPFLAEAAARARAEGAGLEVIYVPSGLHGDEGPDGAKRLAPGAPWLTFPADEQPQRRCAALRALFSVDASQLPVLALLDCSLATVNADAVRAVSAYAPFPWRPRLVWDADDKASWEGDPGRPATATLVLLAERAAASWDACDAALQTVAEETQAQAKALALQGVPPRAVHFLVARETHGLGRAIRRLARLPEAGANPVAVVLDLSDGGAFYTLQDADVTRPDVLRTFLAAHAAGALPKQHAGPVPTITVAAALSNPSAAELLGNASDVGPVEACVQCILCPITCPLLCAFRCCMGCCLLTFLGTAVGVAGMSSGQSTYGGRYGE